MKVTKALKIVLIRWKITRYRLSKTSGVGQPTLSRIINGDGDGFNWSTIDKIASGLEVIDPIAKDAFIGALARPDDCVPDPVGEIRDFDGFDAVEIMQARGMEVEADLRRLGKKEQAKGAEIQRMAMVLALHNRRGDPHTEDPQ